MPIFVGLTTRGNIEIKVFYTWGEKSISKFDPGFNKVIEWDIPLLNGYTYEFLENTANDPGTHHFAGIDNPSIINKIKEYNPDKIVVFGWSFKSHLKVLRYFKNKVPIYFRGDSNLLNNQSSIKRIIRRIFLNWIYKKVDYAISVGTNNRDYYKWVGLKDNQILFAPHAVDENKFVDTEGEFKVASTKMLDDLRIPPHHIVFLYTGKFENRKDLKTLILAKVEMASKPCSLILVGNGPDESVLKELSKSDPNIHFVGFMNQSKMPMIYRCADVFVLPSISETWGLGINEAMNCGLAIIASNKVGAAVDLVNGNGYIFENRNVEDLATKMEWILDDRDKLEEFKQTSTQIIKNWSIDQLVVNFESALI